MPKFLHEDNNDDYANDNNAKAKPIPWVCSERAISPFPTVISTCLDNFLPFSF